MTESRMRWARRYYRTEPALDVDDLAYAISAAEGFPGWTPWGSERTNAGLIAEAYRVIHNREPGTDRATASARLAESQS